MNLRAARRAKRLALISDSIGFDELSLRDEFFSPSRFQRKECFCVGDNLFLRYVDEESNGGKHRLLLLPVDNGKDNYSKYDKYSIIQKSLATRIEQSIPVKRKVNAPEYIQQRETKEPRVPSRS